MATDPTLRKKRSAAKLDAPAKAKAPKAKAAPASSSPAHTKSAAEKPAKGVKRKAAVSVEDGAEVPVAAEPVKPKKAKAADGKAKAADGKAKAADGKAAVAGKKGAAKGAEGGKKKEAVEVLAPAPVAGKKRSAKDEERARVEAQAALEDAEAEAGVTKGTAKKEKGKKAEAQLAEASEPKSKAGKKAKGETVEVAPTPKGKGKGKSAEKTLEETPSTISRPVKTKSTPVKAKGTKASSKSAPKAPSPVLSASASEAGSDEWAGVDDASDAEASGDGSNDHLHGFSTDDADSSDEDDDADGPDIPGIDVRQLPTIAKDDETVRKRLEKAKKIATQDRGVLFLGRIPHGFYEDEMRAYFSQFGDVTRLRISRNKRTGESKHYGFIEFDSSSVAQIVAETMDNYLLMGHILRCKVIPRDEVHPELWVGANRKWRAIPRDRIARVRHNKPRTEEERDKADVRLLRRQDERKRKLADAGIDYDFEEVAYKKKAKPTEA